jgi:serine/threonine-protein kinase
MGAVYEAVQLRLNKRVAIKLMASELAANEEALARFRREAEVTSQLGHPHIVNVFDFGVGPSGEPYLAMEYLEGEDLDHRLRRAGRPPLPSVVDIVKQVASALNATHAKGIVHRDLKPGNVFLLRLDDEADFVKIVDFGISKVKAAATRLTGASVVMGTPSYMSPEQATGRVDEIDHRTDQWALACIAYEMLSGRTPFAGEDAASLLYQVVHETPAPLAALVPGLPAEVDQVLGRALAKEQADRFPTLTAFARAFEAAVLQRPAPSLTEPHAVPRPDLAPAAGPAVGGAPATTFSRTAGEITRARTRTKSRWRWALAGGGLGALVAVTGWLALVRPSGAPREEPRSAGALRATTTVAAPTAAAETTTPPAVMPAPPTLTPTPTKKPGADDPPGPARGGAGAAATEVPAPATRPGRRDASRGGRHNPPAEPAPARPAPSRSSHHLIQDL